MERGDRHVERLRSVDHALDPCLRVGRVGERHRGLRETERPARRQAHAAGERDELGGDVGDAGSKDHIEIKIAVLGLVTTIAAVVVVVLASEIERALSAIVVEDAMRDAARRVAHNQERPVFVEWIAALGIEAERIAHRASQPPPGQVERASLVAEAIVTIARRAGHRMPERMRLLPEKIGLRVAVAGEDRSVRQRPVHAQAVERHGQAQRSGRQRDACWGRGDLGRYGRPRRVVEPRAASPFRVALAERRDGPCALLTDLAPAQQRDPDEVVGQRDDPHLGAVAAVEREPARVGGGQAGAKDRFHLAPAPNDRCSHSAMISAGRRHDPSSIIAWGTPSRTRLSAPQNNDDSIRSV